MHKCVFLTLVCVCVDVRLVVILLLIRLKKMDILYCRSMPSH